MKQEQNDPIWLKISADLDLQYEESGRVNLEQALHTLPVYTAPESAWSNIVEGLPKKVVVRQLTFRKVMGIAAILIIMIGAFLTWQHIATKEVPVQYAKVEQSKLDLHLISDTSTQVFADLKNAVCEVRPGYCKSEEFQETEKNYQDLLEAQQQVLKKAAMYDDDAQVEQLLLHIENEKKQIEQEVIAQIN